MQTNRQGLYAFPSLVPGTYTVKIEAKNFQSREITGIVLHAGDVLTVPQQAGWRDIGASVAVRGEVGRAGAYGIRPGERLSSVLERAGGFSEGAYPYGAAAAGLAVGAAVGAAATAPYYYPQPYYQPPCGPPYTPDTTNCPYPY